MIRKPFIKVDLFQRMVEEVLDYAIIILNTQGDIQSWNLGAERIKGYQAKDIIGRNFKNFYTEEDRTSGKHSSLLSLAYKEGRAQDEGYRVRSDGTTFWASVTITAIHDEDDSVVGFSKVTRDLTERKKAEDAKELHNQELEAKNKELEQFAYIASHDLQEPLQTVMSFSEVLADNYGKRLDDFGRKSLKFITDATNRMSELIKGLLDYSRIGIDGKITRVNLNELVTSVQEDLALSLTESQAKLYIEKLPVIRGYETELRSLFQNLISNAIKFSKPDTSPVIFISVKENQHHHEFRVKDCGIGMEEEHLDRIFIIFQRLHDREHYDGTGIGLAHCRKIVDLHGGKLWVESTPKLGSTFIFTIPR